MHDADELHSTYKRSVVGKADDSLQKWRMTYLAPIPYRCYSTFADPVQEPLLGASFSSACCFTRWRHCCHRVGVFLDLPAAACGFFPW